MEMENLFKNLDMDCQGKKIEFGKTLLHRGNYQFLG